MSTNGNGNYNDGDAAKTIAADAENIGGNVSGSGPAQTYPGSVVAGDVAPPPAQLKKADFVSGQEVRWCPGCGDYSILNNVQKVMPELGIPREKIVFVSGIGCSSRFPYYMNTYGFHSIHGRAPAIATGIKAANPELSVWVVTGDGDALSIGGNHFMHAIRRNLDMNVILFNNRIYGLTKGQYSPTSELGKKTKSTPMGVIDYPLNPLSVAIASEATFVARSLDIDVKHLGATVQAAARHKGVSFIEVYQNCNIFNDGAFEYFTERSVRTDHMLYLEHGQPMIFGKNKDRGIRMNGAHPEVVEIGKDGVTVDDLLVHDIHLKDPSVAFMLARMEYPDFPQPVGIFRAVERDTYEDMMEAQIASAIGKQGQGSLEKLINSGDTWTVE
ncbi:MAG TPA: 2-oxoacid:ferredoxin oxidoreductase subunit beta [Pyrinomonadaceae bacterium]|nr:2-oxoacid:ferredoxin oxidoreductase subunit beta [Pyrinomonadaceae bacterium]